MSIRVLLVDDHQIVREGLRALLRSQDDIEVVAEAQEGRTAVRLTQELSPDVVVLDIAMPDLNGIDATRQIRAQTPGTAIVGLSAHSDQKMATRMLDAGATGFVPKDAAFEELAVAIRTVADNKTYISPKLRFEHPLDAGDESSKPRTSRGLTPREREVLQLMAEGKATKEVAMHLHVSVKTVETQRRHIMEKLNIYSVAELTKYAIREGLTTLDN